MDLIKLEKYLQINLFGTWPSSCEKWDLPGRGLKKVVKHCAKEQCLILRNCRKHAVHLSGVTVAFYTGHIIMHETAKLQYR